MSAHSTLSTGETCPTRSELNAYVHGEAPDGDSLRIESHVSLCTHCMAEVDHLEEHSDVVVRTLAAFPASSDDEQEFQQLQSELLSRLELLPGPWPTAKDADSGGQPPPAPERSLPERLGAYELLDEIGRGATGEVYRVRHLKLDRVFAMKVLYQEQSADAESLDRFLREMKAVGKLDHPHIVRATDAGEDQGYQYLVMEYSTGLDVLEVLRRVGPLSIADACEIARQAALGLQHAHQCGVIHRDVKPSNLLLTAEGLVKLLDLGLVAVRHVHPTGLLETYPRGTADYMAPEQWTDYAHVDERADLYSLGCTLFRMIAGVAPFHPLPDEFASKMTAHLSAEIPRLSALRADVPDELDRVLVRLLAKQPNDRYQSDQALLDDLQPFVRKANLRALAAKIGLQPQGQVGTQPDAAETDASAAPRRVTRRAMVLGGAAAVALCAMYGRRWWTIVPKVDTTTWRPLAPNSTGFLLSLDDEAKFTYLAGERSIQIDGAEYALVNLGRPLTAAFSFHTALSLVSNISRAGVFFRYREAMEKTGLIRGFHVLEVLPRSDRDMSQSVLEWSHVVYRESAPDEKVERTVLASAFVVPTDGSERSELQVTLGLDGFPGVMWNGIPLPESRWVLTREGRHKSQMTKDRLRTDFMGCLGVFAAGGAARFFQPELKYHELH
jgi:tRNA A-37 threonylcarbamoyl transferase component Bud32